jgi:hypothetical protein
MFFKQLGKYLYSSKGILSKSSLINSHIFQKPSDIFQNFNIVEKSSYSPKSQNLKISSYSSKIFKTLVKFSNSSKILQNFDILPKSSNSL